MEHLLRSSPIGLIVAFGAGALSFLSPCVLPLVPGYLSLMSGVQASQLTVVTRQEQRTLLRSTLLFVCGFTAVFVALGASASTVGSALHNHQIGLNRVAGVLVILMGLFLAGFVSPRLLQQERRFHVSPSRLGSWAPPVMGMAFAFGWTPCIGPTLAVVYSLATAQGTLGRGVLLLFFYSLGLGVPFVAAGLAFGRLTGVFGWVKAHFRVINLVAGALLAAFGVLMVTNRVSILSHGVTDVLDFLGLKRLTIS
jgi:cytochrome c-type biogenesis protein